MNANSTIVHAHVCWDEVMVGDAVPALVLSISKLKVALGALMTFDFYPAFVDETFARAQGVDGVFLNTMATLGLLNRHGTDWAGPGVFVARQHIQMVRPIYAGSTVTVTGGVTRVHECEMRGRICRLVDIESEIRDAEGALRTNGGVSLELPLRRETDQ